MVAKLLPIVTAWKHRRYCEPFGGGASILIAKPPVEVETYNDLDGGLVNFFRVLASEEDFTRFYRRVALLPYSRELFDEYRRNWREPEDHVERAARWFVVARQSFGGYFGASWGNAVAAGGRDMAMPCSRWLAALEMLPEIHARLQRVQIEHADFRRVLERYDTDSTLFYCDPPYVHSTRRDGKYAVEMTDADHADLVTRLLEIRGAAVLSGYANDVYKPLEEAGWTRIDWETICFAAGKTRGTGILGEGAARAKQPRVESVWLHPKVAQAYQPQLGLDL